MSLSTSMVNGKIYAIGGIGGPAAVEEYDPATDTWTKKSDMPTERGFLSTSVVNGKIYVMGGTQSNWSETLSTVEEYDPETDTWTTKSDMLSPRSWFGTCVVEGKIYAVGGNIWDLSESFLFKPQKSFEMYDPETDTWTMLAPMMKSRHGHKCAVVNGKIYTFGAFVSYEEMYDPGTDTWVERARMPITRVNPAVSEFNGKVYIFGGIEKEMKGPESSAVFEYDPDLDNWTILDPMPYNVVNASSSVFDGKIYIFGGDSVSYPPYPPYLSSVWEYIPEP
jgi:N-acetylneuraminic acid mutarotase